MIGSRVSRGNGATGEASEEDGGAAVGVARETEEG